MDSFVHSWGVLRVSRFPASMGTFDVRLLKVYDSHYESTDLRVHEQVFSRRVRSDSEVQ